MTELAEQRAEAGTDVAFLVVKRPGMGPAKVGEWHAVMPVEDMLTPVRTGGTAPRWSSPARSCEMKRLISALLTAAVAGRARVDIAALVVAVISVAVVLMIV